MSQRFPIFCTFFQSKNIISAFFLFDLVIIQIFPSKSQQTCTATWHLHLSYLCGLVFGEFDGQAYICFTAFNEGNKSLPELIQSGVVKAEGGGTRIRAGSTALWMDGSVRFITGELEEGEETFFMLFIPETIKELLMFCCAHVVVD